MIIRRRHNGNFTQIGNDVLDDDRLSFEAVGMLAYLLSKPDDWQVRLPQLRKRAKIGRDKLRRILAELVKFGYVLRKKIRDATGAFIGDEFEVYDRPKAVDDPDIDHSAIDLPNDDEPATENPALDEPAPGYPAPEKASLGIYKDSTNTEDSPKPESTKVEREARAGEPEKPPEPTPVDRRRFDDAVKAHWPNLALDDSERGFTAWWALEPDQRANALDRIPDFVALHRSKKRDHLPALSTYFKQLRFEALPPKPEDGGGLGVEVNPGTEAWCMLFFSQALSGRPLDLIKSRRMHSAAEFRKAAWYRSGEIPNPAGWPKIQRDSEQFKAWRKRLGNDGIWLKPECFGEWLWVPSEWPGFAKASPGEPQHKEARAG